MTARRKRSSSGNALIEFTLVGIPLIFVIISTFEMARGMWVYETLGHAVKEGARFASLHGVNCAQTVSTCPVTVNQIANHIQYWGVGLAPDDLTITMKSSSRSGISCTGNTCGAADGTCFPAASACGTDLEAGGVQGAPITITATYQFRSGIAMFWPGSNGIVFGTMPLTASSRELVHF